MENREIARLKKTIAEAEARVATLRRKLHELEETEALEAEHAEDAYCRIRETLGAERCTVARLDIGDIVSFEASTKRAATFWRVTSVKVIPPTRPRRPRTYAVTLSDGRGSSSFGASTKVWRFA